MNNKLVYLSLVVAAIALVVASQSKSVREVIKEGYGSVVSSESLDETVCSGGVCTVTKSGDFQDATTTLFAVQNPRRATSTVTLVTVDITRAATTAIGINVGSSTVRGPVHTAGGAAGAADYRGPHLIEGVALAAGAQGYIRSGVLLASSSIMGIQEVAPMLGVGLNPGTTTKSFTIGPDEWVIGYATGSTAGVTNTNNNFAGRFSVKFEY